MKLPRTAILPGAALLVLVAAGATACGDGPDEPSNPTTAAPTTASSSGTPIVLENPTTTPSGLQYVDEAVGDGETPGATDQVTVNYVGRLAANGLEFDRSPAGQPVTFGMDRVIPGFSEAISTMKVGGKRTALLPSDLAYGAAGFPPDIPPDADLVFEIELVAVN
jgi:FKBP-type peptidyl-prolyl cis-trans isomerase